MKAEEVKAECEELYAVISNSKARLSELRSLCTHEKTFKGNYTTRVARTSPAVICAYCNTVVEWITS